MVQLQLLYLVFHKSYSYTRSKKASVQHLFATMSFLDHDVDRVPIIDEIVSKPSIYWMGQTKPIQIEMICICDGTSKLISDNHKKSKLESPIIINVVNPSLSPNKLYCISSK